MFEKEKLEIAKTLFNKRGKDKTTFKHVKGLEHTRYQTLKSGLIILLHLVNNRYSTIADFQRECNRGRKTVGRLLAVLDELGVPLKSEKNSDMKIYWSLDKDWAKKFKEKSGL